MLVAGAPPSGAVSGSPPRLRCTLLPECRNTRFLISPSFARHPAAGRRSLAKKKSHFPASQLTVSSGLARGRRAFASCWRSSRGLASPRCPPRPSSPTRLAPSTAKGVPLWARGAVALRALCCSLFCSPYKSGKFKLQIIYEKQMCSLKAATRNFRALQPWEGQRRDPCPSAAGARRGRGLPGEQRCPLSPLPLLPPQPPQGSWKGTERNSSHLQETRLLEKHFLHMTQEQISRAGWEGSWREMGDSTSQTASSSCWMQGGD